MGWIILLIFIGLPVMELSVLIDVGDEIGAFSTILLCLLTAAIGLSLVRLQGLIVLRNMQAAQQKGEPIGPSLIHGFFLLLAGICLFIPGFVTDFLGALLLIPPVRLFLGKAGLAHTIVRRTYKEGGSTVIIDGEFQETDNTPPFRDTLRQNTPKTPKNDPEN
ncbi:FxsA family protein [Kordiimonas pumila]|uniref:FxsA family protein n=1 Tax=Kordiimonas pumila TaxID=2161677 RepID=A0ABV7D8U8_9PROT|nr:FxsA family protein [Kordiimonas pumila]